ncbi:MAG: hypothetical protein ACTSRP_02020 [Candidatus Helarchaeota archaeon]
MPIVSYTGDPDKLRSGRPEIAITTSAAVGTTADTFPDTGDWVGYVGDFSIACDRSFFEFRAGKPMLVQKKWVTEETFRITLQVFEWDLKNVNLALFGGLGEVTENVTMNDIANFATTQNILSHGATYSVPEVRAIIRHKETEDNVITIYIWKAEMLASFDIPFPTDDVIAMNLELTPIPVSQDWWGNPAASYNLSYLTLTIEGLE